jgi:hypothetical protein
VESVEQIRHQPQQEGDATPTQKTMQGRIAPDQPVDDTDEVLQTIPVSDAILDGPL